MVNHDVTQSLRLAERVIVLETGTYRYRSTGPDRRNAGHSGRTRWNGSAIQPEEISFADGKTFMPLVAQQFLLLVGKDLKIEARSRQTIGLVIVLGLLIVVVLGLGLGGGAAVGFGATVVLWVAYLFSRRSLF